MKLPPDLCDLSLGDMHGRSDDLEILKHYEDIVNAPIEKRKKLPGDLQTLVRHELRNFVLRGESSDIVRAMVCAVLSACTVKFDESNKRRRAEVVFRATGLTAQPREIIHDESLHEVNELIPWVGDQKTAWEDVGRKALSDHDAQEGVDGAIRLKEAQRRKSKPK